MDDDCRSAAETIHQLRMKERTSHTDRKAAADHIRVCREPSCEEIKRTMVGDPILDSVFQA